MRSILLGRKSFHFAKSPIGAIASGICYSIIETTKANGLIPYQYLNFLFEMLPNIDLDNHVDLNARLPWSETLPEIIK
ncbi:MAG: transposase domain-containing protein [Dethiosulfatibacter sp.]|nr:transposase domain-containing protein [Dethiosulfatibacter sp.]